MFELSSLALILVALFLFVAWMAPSETTSQDPRGGKRQRKPVSETGQAPPSDEPPGIITPKRHSQVGCPAVYIAHPRDARHGPGIREGQELAAVVVADFRATHFNLQVFLDGQNHTAHPDKPISFWVGSSEHSQDPGPGQFRFV